MSTFGNKTFEPTRTEFSFSDILEYAPIGILIFQRDWKIRFVNSNFFRFPGILGGSPQNVIGQSIYENRLLENLDLRPDLDELKKGIGFEKELSSSKTFSGGKISLLLKGSPISSGDEFAGGVIVLEDVKISVSETIASIKNNEEFNKFLNNISDFYFLVDKEGTVLESKKSFNAEFSFLLEPELNKNVQNVKKISSVLLKSKVEWVVNNKSTLVTDIPYLHESKEKNAKISLIALCGEVDQVETIVVMVQNQEAKIEDSGVTEEELKELYRYQTITTSVVDGLICVNKNGRIIFWNESASRLFGLTKSEVYGKSINKIFQYLDEKAFEKIKLELETNNYWDDVLTIGYDESIAEYFKVKIRRINEDKEDTYVLLCENITKEVKKQKELVNSEEKFKSIVLNSLDFICTLDLNAKITFANTRFYEAFKYDKNELQNISFYDLINPEYLLENSFTLQDIAKINSSVVELPMINKSGHKLFVLSNFTSVKDNNGNPVYYNVILTDITLKKESEKDLYLIRSVFEASQDGIVLFNKMKLVLVNDSFVRMFGYVSTGEMLKQNLDNLMDEPDKKRILGYFENPGSGPESPLRFDFIARRKNNTTFVAEVTVSVYEIEKEKFVVWVLRDETEQRKIQQALQESEERYRSISDSINECIWAAEDKNGEMTAVFYTPAVKRITGFEPKAFLEDPELWGKITHPDDADYIDKTLDRLFGDPIRSLETLEYRIIDILGNIIWIENKITVIRDSKGKVQKVFGIISDISSAKHAEEELKKSSQQLKESNDTKDRFISIISHDLRTPFTSIIGFTDLLLTEKDMPEDKRIQYIEFVQESAKSMLGLVNSLLDWTRLQTNRIKYEPDRINAMYLINTSIQILSGASLQKGINLVSEIDKDLYIHADENLLLQVFNNLISNAIKFTKAKGTITVKAMANIDKKHIEFRVVDNGIGIKKENLDKLFKVDTKYTTPGTEGEKGSGLGLSLVHDIIKKHGGDIWVESVPGKGSQFIFSIPVASLNLLLVDDIKTDRLLYSKLINSLIPNYTILEAADGKQALDVIKQSLPALVITDHNMPVMSGYDLVKQLQIIPLKYKPPIIVLSSDINKSIEAEYRELGVEFIFQKPVNLGTFKNAIERSLRKAIYN